MFGAILRLMAAGEVSRRLGDYLKRLAAKYLMLSAAGMIFLVAIVFAILALFWALISSIHNPVLSAAIMAGALAFAGLLIVLIAYGITTRKPPSARRALHEPLQVVEGRLPSVDDIGRQIEDAVRHYGPIRVTAAAAATGLAAAIIAKRFGQLPSQHPARLNEGPALQRRRRHRMLRDSSRPLRQA